MSGLDQRPPATTAIGHVGRAFFVSHSKNFWYNKNIVATTKKKKQNNYAFIDSQNLNLAIRDQGWILDFQRFRQYLKDKYHIAKAYLFLGYISDNKKLYNFLKRVGYKIIFKPIVKRKDGDVKGNIDAELVLWTMIEYDNYDRAVIITGDGDFYCLVNYLNKKGKLLKLLVPNVSKYSSLLKPFAPNKLDFMNNLKNKLAYKKGSQLHKDQPL